MKISKFGVGSVVIAAIAFAVGWALTSAFWPGSSIATQVLHMILATAIGVFATIAFLGFLVGLIAIIV